MKTYLLLFMTFVIIAALFAGCTGEYSKTSTTVATSYSPSPSPAAQEPSRALVLTGTTWKLGWFDDTKGVWSSVAQGSTITAMFMPDGTITGSNGCIQYNTTYVLLKTPEIWIRRPVVPEITCKIPTGVNDQQSEYYTDLLLSVKYTVENNQLLMFDKTGKKILQFDAVL